MKRLLRATVMGTILWVSPIGAEQLCYRTSDCEQPEYCRPVPSSAMGLCTLRIDPVAQRRAEDREEFNPWVQGGGISLENDNVNEEGLDE